jgi:uncharacterized membrane protein YcaP (DUF421 family)
MIERSIVPKTLSRRELLILLRRRGITDIGEVETASRNRMAR